MAFKKGHKKTGGKKKGTPNKITADIKDAILNAFNKVGGVAYLEKVAKDDPKTFCMLIGKVLPTQLAGDPENPIAFSEITRKIIKTK